MSVSWPESETTDEQERWFEALYDAFGDPGSNPLEVAEQALRACPGDPIMLKLASLAALLEERPERCLVFLKRVSKRYVPNGSDHLLRALALAQQRRFTLAATLLERYGLGHSRQAMPFFPGGPALGSWLEWWLERIRKQGRAAPARSRRPASKPAAKPGRGRAAAKGRPAKSVGPPPASPASPAPPRPSASPAPPRPSASPAPPRVPRDLPRPSIAIPVDFELSLAGAADPGGGPGAGQDAAWFRLRSELTHLSLLQGFDELLCRSQLRGVDAYWHQEETVRKVLKQFRGRVLLADEVGLGKTVEAGMVLKEYLLRGMAERVLILTPASLVGQWRDEMDGKFGVPCLTSHDPLLRRDPERFWDHARVIASIAVARRKDHFERIVRRSYDVVIVDEAHHLRNRATRNYKLVDALNKRFLLLLSATPVQNSLIELYNLLTLLQPGIFKTEKEFRSAYMTPGKPRLPVNRDRMRDLMRGAMIRNTRALVAVRLPRRHALTRQVEATAEEAACYRDLSVLVRDSADLLGGRQRLSLHHLLTAAGSSPPAAATALRRFAERHAGGARWTGLAARYGAIALGAKEAALLELLHRNPDEKKMVFIHHRETLSHLGALLSERGISFARFDGGLSGPEKDAAIDAFRESAPVLLCTESGGEGRNLQFCNTLINFDIPWNPMVIEQRIGRIDRIGQEREVFVFNLVARDTLEDRMLAILDEKINMFELVVGEVGAILGEMDEDKDFAEMILGAWLESTETGREAAFSEVGRRMVEAKRTYESAKTLDDELFGQDFETA